MTEIKTNEEILKEFGSFPSPFNAEIKLYNEIQILEAMQASNEQAVRVALEMAADTLTDNDCVMNGLLIRQGYIANDLHPQVMDKLKTPTK